MHIGRETQHRQPIQHLLSIPEVLRPEVEVELNVAQPEDGQRPDVPEAGHSKEGRLDGDRDLSLNFFGRPPRILGDHLDHGRGRIRVGDDVEDVKGVEAAEEEGQPEDADEDPLNKRELDQPGDHRIEEGPEPSVRGRRRARFIPWLPVL